MKSINFSSLYFCTLGQVLLPILCFVYIPQALAAASNNLNYLDLSKLASLETIVYGSARKSLPSEKRIDSLEKTILGKSNNGPIPPRIDAIAAIVTGGHDNLLAPPIAPELDRSENSINDSTPPLAPRVIPGSGYIDSQTPSEARQDRIKVMLQQAMQLYSKGQIAQSEAIFKNVLSLDSQNTDANFNLGAIAESRSDWQTALRYYQVALKNNPTDADTRSAVQAMKDKVAHTSSAKPPQNIDALREKVNQAANDYQKGNYDAAISKLKMVLNVAPNQADVQYALSQAYKAKGQYADARSALMQATALSPDNQQYKNALNELDQKMTGNNNQPLADQYSANDSSAPKGQITPFTATNDSQQGWQSTSTNRSYNNNNYYMPPYANGMSGSMNGYAYNNYASSNVTNRIERAAIGSLAGAAIGSMFSGYGNRNRGAFTGAMIGGMFGLMSGGGGGRRW